MSKGFTIIELIIAIFVLSVAVVGIFSAFSIIVVLTSDTADRLTATYLAQEGMEIVRNIRDTNWLYMDICAANMIPFPMGVTCPATWVDKLNVCASGCEADYTTAGTGTTMPSSISVWASPGRYLKIDSSQYSTTYGFYNYLSGTDSKFKRKI